MTNVTLPHFLSGGGQASDEIFAFDWSGTSAGPICEWPASLRTAVSMMVSSRFPKAIFWGPDLLMLHNDAFRPILGAKRDVVGRPMAEVWSEVWDDIRPIAERALQGEATYLEDLRLVIDRGEVPETCYFTFCYSPIRDEAGHIAGFIDTVIETTGKVEAEHALRMQNAELSHRIQNTLAIVASIARKTLKSTSDTTAAWTALSARIGALAKTHEVLRAGAVPAAPIGEIIRLALRAHGVEGPQFSLSGPDFDLPERQALALSLAVNELATNAIKHGALSVDRGRVAIDWGVTGDPGRTEFWFRWREEGGPPVSKPRRLSFGTTLLSSVVPSDFGGEAALGYEPGGVTYDLTCDYGNLA